jgi:hypothetical protein
MKYIIKSDDEYFAITEIEFGNFVDVVKEQARAYIWTDLKLARAAKKRWQKLYDSKIKIVKLVPKKD